jgi:nucleoside-diphosphate-sugar epimerase
MRLTVTGGLGYIGSVLVPKLLAADHHVRVVDIGWFGNHLQKHPKLKIIEADIRDDKFPIGATDAIIHLAAVANDPTGELDPKLTWEINALATTQLAARAVSEGVKQFIYASSGSVYGTSEALEVTEDSPLMPLSEYNKTKMVAERVLLSYADKMAVQILRPATVCGVSPRMRLDVMVNSLTMQAINNEVMKFNGGDQYRPNVHIEDMADAYLWFLARPLLTGIYNVGFENLRIKKIAYMVGQKVNARSQAMPMTDKRSYRINSDKLLATGFRPKKTVADAIAEIVGAVKAGLQDTPQCHNLLTMQKKAA